MSDAREARRFEPPVNDASEPFWDATREKRFLLQWCKACDGEPIFYPREVCPRCLAPDLEWREASGRGVVHAVSVQHRPGNPKLAEDGPYPVVLVDLDEGARMMSNVVGCPADEVVIGMGVELTWEPLSDGRNLPLFEPAKEA